MELVYSKPAVPHSFYVPRFPEPRTAQGQLRSHQFTPHISAPVCAPDICVERDESSPFSFLSLPSCGWNGSGQDGEYYKF